MTSFHSFMTAGLAALAVTGCVNVGGPLPGDYGDAPDGGPTGYPGPFAQVGAFPTLSANNGAVAQDAAQIRLGPGASIEIDANDPADPDGQPNLNPANTDSDDGLVDFVLVLTSIPPLAALTVSLTAPPGSGGGNFFVNALIDMNLDGEWGGVSSPGVPEWVVKNFPVSLSANQSTPVALPPFAFGFGNRLPDGAWLRLLVSREAVTVGDWDGSGSFTAGEVEDHVIRLPTFGPTQKRLIIAMSCPDVVRFAPGAGAAPFRCPVRNIALGATAGSFSYSLTGFGANPLSVRVLPLVPPATRGCLANGFPPGGPVSCGNPPGDIPIAGAGPVTLRFAALRTGGPLPSQWTYSAVGEDPPAVVTAEGVTVGFGDSRGNVAFIEEPVEDFAEVQIGEQREVLLLLKAKDPTITAPVEVLVRKGESFRGLSYAALSRLEGQTIDLPPLR